jgi:hypothetical protein
MMRINSMRTILAGVLLALVVIQFVPVDRSNPPVETDVPASPELKSILRRACYDCHSHETVWPWYSRVAPVSWLIQRDVREGRRELNFSTWNRYTAEQRANKMAEAGEEAATGEMPPWFYLPAHPKARLSQSDKDILQAWLTSIEPGHEAERGAF